MENILLKTALILSMSLLLSACQSVGTQYIPPKDAEGSALFLGGGVFINSFNEDGCYSGRTNVTESIKLHPDKEVVMAVDHHYFTHGWRGDKLLCRVFLSFIPQKGEKYQLVFDDSQQASGKNLLGRESTFPVCNVSVVKWDGDGSKKPILIKGLKLSQQRLTCIKAVPIAQPNQAQNSERITIFAQPL